MNTETIRAKFEAWAKAHFVDPNLGGFRTGNTGDSFSYNDDDIEIAWESWQASHQQAVKDMEAESKLKVFTGSYYEPLGYGNYEDYEETVVANTKSEALGMLLETLSDSKAKFWSIGLVDDSKAGVIPS